MRKLSCLMGCGCVMWRARVATTALGSLRVRVRVGLGTLPLHWEASRALVPDPSQVLSAWTAYMFPGQHAVIWGRGGEGRGGGFQTRMQQAISGCVRATSDARPERLTSAFPRVGATTALAVLAIGTTLARAARCRGREGAGWGRSGACGWCVSAVADCCWCRATLLCARLSTRHNPAGTSLQPSTPTHRHDNPRAAARALTCQYVPDIVLARRATATAVNLPACRRANRGIVPRRASCRRAAVEYAQQPNAPWAETRAEGKRREETGVEAGEEAGEEASAGGRGGGEGQRNLRARGRGTEGQGCSGKWGQRL